MGLNLTELPYLVFRLAPIIIVSFFILQSFLLWDVKGVIYISGLLLTTVAAIFSSNVLSGFVPLNDSNTKNPQCNTITLGENGEYYSDIPLNLVVYSFTFFYLLIFIFNLANTNPTNGILDTSSYTQISINSALQQNIPVLIFFPLLILVELWWISTNNCISDQPDQFAIYALAGIIVGAIGGIIWAVLITSLRVPQLQYIVSKREDVCSRPSKSTFRCKPKT
jgi:hypothetical protein